MPVVDGLPRPVVRGYVAPWQSTAGPPEHPVDHGAVIGPPATALRLLAGQQRLPPGPFLVGQIVSIEHPDGLPHPPVKIRGTRSDMEAGPVKRQGEAVPMARPLGRVRCPPQAARCTRLLVATRSATSSPRRPGANPSPSAITPNLPRVVLLQQTDLGAPDRSSPHSQPDLLRDSCGGRTL